MPSRAIFITAVSLAILLAAACTQDFDKFSVSPGEGGSGGTIIPECYGPEGCPEAPNDCQLRSCISGQCDFVNVSVGTPCATEGGRLCDANGHCVECNEDLDCEDICQWPDCVCHLNECAPAPCFNSIQDGSETDVDCGGAVCDPCANGLVCLDYEDCVSRFCDYSQGSGGAGGAGGTGGAGGAAGGAGGAGGAAGGAGGAGGAAGGTGGAGGAAGGSGGSAGTGGTGGTGTGGEGVCAPCAEFTDCAAAPDAWCANGECVDQKPDSTTCAGDDECLSGHCPAEDGVCCDTACNQTCEACLQAKTGGNDGVCALIPSSDDPDAECVDQGAASCGPNGTGCEGTTAECNLYDATTECSAAVCTGGQETAAEYCDGLGSCMPEATVACDPYTCDGAGVGCLASCTLQTDCSAGSYCDGTGTCVAQKIDGASCTAPAAGYECLSGSCVDGVCCNTACSGSCEACTAVLNGGTDGTCGFIPIYQDPQSDCPLPGEVCGGDGSCIYELAGSGLLVRYFMDEAASGQAPTQLLDSGPAALHLALDYNASATELIYVEDAGNRGLSWNPVGNGSRAFVAVGTSVISTLNGSTTGTIEVVFDVDDVIPQGSRISHIGDGSPEDGRFTLSADSTNVLQVYVNALVGEYPVDLPAAGRIVVHAVLDTNEAVATDRIKLYLDGGTPLTATGGTPPGAGATIILGAGRSYVIGNHISQTRSPLGRIYYAALYSSALTAAEVAQNAAVLTASDDAP